MHRPSGVPAEVDLSRPIAARVHDHYLEGSHGLEVDRRMARDAISLWPELPAIIYSRTPTPMRSREEIARFPAGFDLVDPELVWWPLWRPDEPDPAARQPERMTGFAGVGRLG